MDGMSAITYHRLAMPFAMIRELDLFDIKFAITEPEIKAVNAKDYDVIIFSRYIRHNTKLLSDAKKIWCKDYC